MAYNEAYQKKLDLFKSCIHMEKPERVPNLSNFFTWKILDSEYPLSQALGDFDILEKITCEFHERYQLKLSQIIGL